MGDPVQLHTRSTTYRIAPTASGSGLRQCGWGPRGDTPDLPGEPSLPGFDTADDLIPHEFAVGGTRHVLESELLVRRTDRCDGARVRLVGGPHWEDTADTQALTYVLADTAAGVRVELTWRVSARHDVVVRGARVTNTGAGTLTLARAFTGAFNLPLPGGAVVDALSGQWCAEFTPTRIVLPRGTWSMGSRQGLTSHLWAPVVTVSDPSDAAAGCWSVAVAWSGSWQLDVHATSRAGWVRVAGGIHPETPITLRPGETFVAPELLGLWASDPDAAARAWHDHARADLLRAGQERRPVSYNSWFATGFDVRCDQQRELARRAASLGCELFVLDDGWFAGRRGDDAGLGDWTPDPVAFPDGLGPLVDEVHAAGMRFGLWVEPEGVNADSELYRAHPDWIHRSPHREPVTIRNQFVLDLGRPQVEAWVLATLRRLVAQGVDHLKWDMNRALTDAVRPGDIHGREAALEHTRAYHRILTALRTEFGDLTVEACAGGGARIAAPVLARSDVVWPSDETGPRDRLAIQHGFLSAFPATVMSSWVTDVAGHRDPAPASLTYRFCVAMCGVLGVGADPRGWSEAEVATARRLIALYKGIRPVVLAGAVYRHGDPRDHGYAVEYAGAPGDPRAVVMVFGRPDAATPVMLRPRAAGAATHPRLAATGASAAWVGDRLRVELDADTGAGVIVLG